jgi:hypothetical protein
MYHGFILANNSHDCVQLQLTLNEAEMTRLDRLKADFVLQALRLDRSTQVLAKEFCLSSAQGMPRELWLFLSLQVGVVRYWRFVFLTVLCLLR